VDVHLPIMQTKLRRSETAEWYSKYLIFLEDAIQATSKTESVGNCKTVLDALPCETHSRVYNPALLLLLVCCAAFAFHVHRLRSRVVELEDIISVIQSRLSLVENQCLLGQQHPLNN
jgi:hypothetical protein